MKKRFFLDWVPFSSLPINCEVLSPVTLNSNGFDSFFDQPISPFYSTVTYKPILSSLITDFGYCIRNDGLIVFWFTPNEVRERTDVDKDANIALVLSYGLKEKLNHRHAFHGPVNDESFSNFQPVHICSFEDDIPLELASIVTKKQWEENINVESRTKMILEQDTAIDQLLVHRQTNRQSKLALSKLRENFSGVYNSFFRQKDKIRVGWVVANNPSFITFMFMAGICTPLWQESATQHEHYIKGLAFLFTTTILLYIALVLGVFKLIAFINTFLASKGQQNGPIKQFMNRLFADKAPIKRKILYPISIIFVLSIIVYPHASHPIFLITDAHSKFLSGMGLSLETFKTVLTRDSSLFTISFFWIFGIFLYGAIEVLVKRMKILKLCRYTIGILYFGNNYTKILTCVRKHSERKKESEAYEVNFNTAIKSIQNFMAHEYLKLVSATVLIFVSSILALIPVISTKIDDSNSLQIILEFLFT